MINILYLVLAFTYMKIFSPMLLNMIGKTNLVNRNYRGEEIPNSFGIAFTFCLFLVMLSIKLLLGKLEEDAVLFLLGFSFMGFIGFIDDSIGDTDIKGLKGHFKAFFKGNLTTGGIKALLGLAMALFVSLDMGKPIFEIIINTLIIALSINALNLFDLRPGRAIKVFLIISIIPFIIYIKSSYNYIILSVYGIIMAYSSFDFKALAMMGDSGSNSLGFTLGFFLCLVLDIKFKLIYLVFLILIHYIAEKSSFTKIIEANRFLNFIDKIGR